MLVSDLQQFFLLLLPPLRALGINTQADKSVTGGLEAVAEALSPFKDLATEQLCDLLRAAHEYRQTGELPEWVLARKPRAARPRKATPKAPKQPKMTREEALAKLEALQSQSQGLDPEIISREVESLLSLSAEDLKVVQKEFLGTMSGKTKQDRLDAIKRRIFSHRQNRLRSEEILHG